MATFQLVTVISSLRIKCNTSTESSQRYFHFIFLHRQALNNLRGRYDPQTEKNPDFFHVTVSFLHIDSGVVLLLKAVTYGFISPFYTDKLSEICEDWIIFYCSLCSVTYLFCSKWLLFETTN